MAVHSFQAENHAQTLPRIGLALSGGASRGIAHLGVLQALQDAGIKPGMISGTSVGAVAGAFYAFGVPIERMLNCAKKMTCFNISTLTIAKTGVLSNAAIGKLIRKHIGNVNIEDSPLPLAIITTDIRSGEKVVLRRGNLARAVMASCCLPGLFKPVEIEGRLLVDGFLVDNVPISPLREMGAEVLLAVCLSRPGEYREPGNMLNIFLNACEISIDLNTRATLGAADILITPDLSKISDDAPERAAALFDEGYAAARRVLPEIYQLIRKRAGGYQMLSYENRFNAGAGFQQYG